MADCSKYGDKVLESACLEISQATGSRHDTRLRKAKLVGGYVASGHISEDSAIDALIAAALVSEGDNPASCKRDIIDGINFGKAAPLYPPDKKKDEPTEIKTDPKWIYKQGISINGQGHTYLTAKGVPSHPILRLSVYPKYFNDLIIPGFKAGTDDIQTVVFIPEKPNADGSFDKKNLSRHPKKGACVPLSDWKKADKLFFCEGIATGLSLNMAIENGSAVICCFDCGNILPVVTAFRAARKDAEMFICADNDEISNHFPDFGGIGVAKAKEAAKTINAGIFFPPEISDFNDVHTQQGLDAVKNLLSGQPEYPKSFFDLFREKAESDLAYPFQPEILKQIKDIFKSDKAEYVNIRTFLKNLKDFPLSLWEKEVVKKEKKPPATPASPEFSELPEIFIRKGEFAGMADQAEIAILNADYNIYQQCGILKKLSTLKSIREGIERSEKNMAITDVQPAYLFEAFSNCAKWKKGDEPANPPDDVISLYMARSSWKVPIITGIIHTPIIRRDGTILQNGGYDRQTGIYYQKSCDFDIPENPDLSDAKKAMELLLMPLSEFPFQESHDKSVIIAALLTALARKTIGNAPMFAFTAPTPGSGKGLCCKYVSLIASGGYPTIIHIARDRTGQETEKRFSSALMAGDPVWNIDNIEFALQSEFLCSILTESEVSPRFLGRSQNIKTPTNVTIMATGNNMQLKGDLPRRTLMCCIDPGVERPEQRQFKLDFESHIKQNRTALVTAGLTILRAWIISPEFGSLKLPYWGSYEDGFSQWVRGAIVWCGLSDPYKGNEKARVDDNDTLAVKGFLSVMLECYGDKAVTTKEIIADSQKDDSLSDVLHAVVNDPAKMTAQLGYFLRKHKDRVYGGLKVVSAGAVGRAKAMSWKIVGKKAVAASPSADEEEVNP